MAMQQGTGGTSYAMAGFIAMAFAVVGMTGIMAAHVARLPLDRVIAREAVLDQALALARARDAAGLEALRPLLGDSAAAVLAPGVPAAELGGAGFEARLAAERTAMRLRRAGEAQATAGRLRMLLIVVTIVAAGFAAAALLVGRRVAPDGKLG